MYMYKEIYYMELAKMLTKVEKSQDLPSVNCSRFSPCRADHINSSPKASRLKAS